MSNFHNNGNIRVTLEDFDDSGKQQTVRGQGRPGEKIGDAQRMVHKVGMHGVISVPWKGSHGVGTPIGSNPDQIMAHGFEHPDKRYRGGEEGDGGCYRDQDNYCVFKSDRVYLKTNKKVIIEADGDITLKAGGNIILEPGGKIYLGGADASRALAAKDTEDTGGFLDVGNLLDKVVGK